MRDRILVMEDSPTQARTLKATLEAGGFEVTLAADGEQGLEELAGKQFDLVLSDIVMPGISGFEVCRQVKARDPHLPVVLLTSLTDPLEVVRGLEAGADNFLHKPYDGEYLLSRLRTILFNQQLRREGKAQMGLELFFLGRRFMITADRQQILDLLVSTFEDLVGVNHQLRERERELAQANADVSARLQEVELERQRLDAVLAGLPQGMVVVDADGVIVEANAALARLLGARPDALEGRSVSSVTRLVDRAGTEIPQEQQPLATALAGELTAELGTAFDLCLERSDDSRLPVICRAAAIRDNEGRTVGAVGLFEEIGGLMAYDALTGLPGHAVFADRVATAVDVSATEGLRTAVMAVVVDHFDRLRNNLSPAARDGFIAEMARRLEALLVETRAGHMAYSAAYLGNGDFAVVTPGLGSDVDAMRVGQWLGSGLGGSVVLDGVDIPVTVSVGIALPSPDDHEPRQLVSVAAAAARRASSSGGTGVLAADSNVHVEATGQLRAEQELREAIADGQLSVYYQPQMLLSSGRPSGAEALVRWEHPDRGVVPAYEFISVAEDAGLISKLSWSVLEDACRQAATWRAELLEGDRFVMSVNLAREQLGEADAAERVKAILQATGLDPQALVLEVTETGVMTDAAAARVQLDILKAAGVRVAVDDFGTGHSSLKQLRNFPVDIVKIDRTFVAGLLSDDEDAAIVAGTTRLAHALGLEVIAEGVEDDDQLMRLRVLGCEGGQGYLWSPALPAEEFSRWWQARAQDPRPTQATTSVVPDDTDSGRDDVLAYLVHELASPLTAVLGFSEILLTEVTDGPARSHAEAVVRNAQDLNSRLRLLADTRAMSEGKISLETRPLDVASLVRTTVDDLTTQLAPHEVTVDADTAAVAPVDGDRLVQAVTNLLTNAAKFSPPDAPIGVTVADVHGRVEVGVRDHGPGVPEHRRPELFRRFARLGSKTKGMGIGLYLCRTIALAHGGDIRYEPAPSGGACFVLSFPRNCAST